MKKAFFILPIIVFILFESCNDNFNINAPYLDVYILNCILRNDSTTQYAIFSKNNFTENGVAPTSNSTAQNIKGASIKISYINSVLDMRDTTIELNDSGNTRVNCYYTKDLVLNPGQVISIEASIPGGDKLESTIRVPKISFPGISFNFPQLFRMGYQERPYYYWSWIGNSEGILNLPQLEIYYQKYEGGTYVDKKILVPLALYYIYNEYGIPIPVNVKLSFNNYCVTTLENVNKTMREISGDDPNKKNYIINKVLFNVISLGPDLSKFYSAYNTYAQDFTIKLRQTDYSNIKGGKGIFGVYYKFSKSLTIDSLYINSFGYQYDPR